MRITEYDAEYAVDEDGTLIGKETITGDFPYGRHGIFRYWDLKDFGDEHVRLVPKDIEITRDGEDEPRGHALGVRAAGSGWRRSATPK